MIFLKIRLRGEGGAEEYAFNFWCAVTQIMSIYFEYDRQVAALAAVASFSYLSVSPLGELK